MRKTSHGGNDRARAVTGDNVGKQRQGRRLISAVMQMVRGKFGAKASLELALRTNADQRSGERWLAGKSMTAENFAALVCSDVGDQVLHALMGDDPKAWPSWYCGFRRQSRISTLRRGLASQQRAIEELEREGAL